MVTEDEGFVSSRRISLPPLSTYRISISDETLQLLERSERLIRLLSAPRNDSFDDRVFADACMYIEVLADVKSAGKQLGARQVFLSMHHRESGKSGSDSDADEMLRTVNVLKLVPALRHKTVTSDTFLDLHRHLLAGTTREPFRAKFRSSCEQVGGSRFHTFGMPYNFPEAHEVPELISDLAAFCNSATLPPVAQAALAHAQYSAIHPFERANGKMARMVTQLVLCRRGLVNNAIFPLTASMVTSSHDYQAGMAATIRNLTDGLSDADELDAWLAFFADSCISTCSKVALFQREVSTLQARWLAHMASRSDSATTLLVHALPAMPLFSASSAAEYIDRSFKRTTTAISALKTAGIIKQTNEGRRNRLFECPEIMDAYAHIKGFQ